METGFVNSRSLTGKATTTLCEYLLSAKPDAVVAEWVKKEKKEFSEEYQVPLLTDTCPQIPVAHFMAKEEMEPTILRWMHRIISNQKSFRVTMDQYSGFPSHAIYLKVKEHKPFQQLATAFQVIDQYVRGYGCPEMFLNTHPHITIARGLKEHVYEQAMKDHAEKKVQASFELKELVLFRKQHPMDICRQVNVFGLRPD